MIPDPAEVPTISVYYFWLNTQEPPFDDVRVRQAVNYALDPAALERIYAGTVKRTQQILPSQMPGYEKFELYPHDLAKAKELMRKEGERRKQGGQPGHRGDIVKSCGLTCENSQAATFSSCVVVSSSVTFTPSLNFTPLSTSAISSWPLNRRQRSWAVESSL